MSTEMPWYKWYPPEISPHCDYPEHNLAQFLINSAEKRPNYIAMYFMGKQISYGELLEQSYKLAHALQGLGVHKGDRVALMLPNTPHAVVAYYGALMLGAIVVQTNPLYTERELQLQLVDSGATVIITLDFLHKKVLAVQPHTSIKQIIVGSIKDYLPFPKNLLYPMVASKDGFDLAVNYSSEVIGYKKILASSSKQMICVEVDAKKDLALLQYTGGTTGISKGVMLTHYNLIANTIQNANWCYNITPGNERYLAALPFFHVFGMTVLMNLAILQGDSLILLPKFEAQMVMKTISKMKATVFPGAPTMYIALIHHPRIQEYDLSSIKVCVSGAAPLPREVQEVFESLTGGKLIEGYGLTEASPVTHANLVWGYRKIGTIGIPYPDTEAKIVHPETGVELPIGEIGELIVRGPQVMVGYWNRPQDTAATLRDGWLYTGDLGTMDNEGFFAIVDRKKDLIIASGFNVYPREIEEVLYEHSAIQEAVAVGVPDDYRGETVKAYIVLKAGSTVSQEELNVWCRERLAAYKVPRLYEFRNTLPKSLVGKVLRRKLLEEEMERNKEIS
ncbi:long-chain fatty acid--CoA ligase [Paenibacillus albiflavus]|uniref:Long-chain fatty acid--CoA ligase n=1 Tax=Paenibacillus albiflavus TaxID=2545760 RepID=A0A4R4EL67_9BACL|nr:AMP-binding protein [Paenibacillus albiflavus]TCZ80984.1 long-chain fatty acid--CoA ligase [Paenibacillus albiflavus]